MAFNHPACAFDFSSSWNKSEEEIKSLIIDLTGVLAEYSWVYSTRNTEIFVHDVLEKIPAEWTEAISSLNLDEYKKVPFGFIKHNWPISLKQFLEKATKLAELRFPLCQKFKEVNNPLKLVRKDMPLKKQKEIVLISDLVNEVCCSMECNKILDIGSGLGYLNEFLHQAYGLCCIGVDSVKRFTENALQRLRQDPCINCMHHETVKIQYDKDCIEKLQNILSNFNNLNFYCSCKNSKKVSATSSYVMVGLHCCGNLTQDMMKIFCDMDHIKAFICVGCCYNKINLSDFPMSQAVMNAINTVRKDHPQWQPCTSGLRLASHATRTELKQYTLEDLKFAEKSLSFRSVLEFYIKKENIHWRKPKRRIRAEDLENFDKYCDIMLQKGKQRLSEVDHKERMKKLWDIYSSKQLYFQRIRVLLILQILLQPLYECFVMLDRMMYFKENSIDAKVIILWDDSLSPRNMAIYAMKN